MRIRIAIMVIIIGGVLCFAGHITSTFYFLLPNSDVVFKWKHQLEDHLYAYTDQWDYSLDDPIRVYASNGRGKRVQADLIHLPSGDTVWHGSKSASYQSLPDLGPIHGINWNPSFEIQPDTLWETGWYMLSLARDDFSFRTSLMIRPTVKTHQKEVAILLSTNTWNAYNHWGGYSLYSRNKTHRVSFLRPQLLADPYLENSIQNHQLYYQAANKDLPLAQLLDSLKIPFDAFPMDALHQGDPALMKYKVWVMATHSEYWTQDMLSNLNQGLDSGISLINLAGNVAAYKSEMDETGTYLSAKREIPSLWEEQEEEDSRPFGLTPKYLGFHTYAPYEVMVDSSWLLKGTKLQKGDRFGGKSDTYDYTYMYVSLWTNLLGILNKGKYGAASGLEIDKVYSGTPSNWVTVASGLNARIEGRGEVFPEKIEGNWKAGDGADLGYYFHPGGGMVLSVGSMAFTGAIPHDKNIQHIINRAIRRCLDK